MPIGTSNGEYFEDENDHAYQTHFAGKVTDPVKVPDSFSNAPRSSTALPRGNLGDILGMDVHDIPEGVSARDYFQQLQRQTDENYKTNSQKPVTMAPQKGASMEDPTGARDLFLVRHGCTDLNAEGGTSVDKIRGWKDVPLNDVGRDDARKAAESLEGKGITAIVASDLSRAKETADIIGQKIGVTPTYTMKLRPWDLGDYTGKSAEESRPALKEYSTAKADEKVPGGESFNNFKFRALQGVSEALQQHPNDQVAVVTHHRVERLLNAWDEQGQPTDGELHEPTFLQKGEPPGGHQIINISPNIHRVASGDVDGGKATSMVANDKGQPGTEGPYYEYDDNSEIHLNSMKEYNDNIHKIPDNWENIIQDKSGKVTIKGPKYTPPLVGSITDEDPSLIPNEQYAANISKDVQRDKFADFGRGGKGNMSTGAGESGMRQAPDYSLEHHMTPERAPIRLRQLLSDKASTKKAGGDVESSDYGFYNNQIRSLRSYINTLK